MFQTAHLITTEEGVEVLIRESRADPSGDARAPDVNKGAAKADPSGDARAHNYISERR